MKIPDQSALHLLTNRYIFEEIHQIKAFFVSLFSGLANELPAAHLSSIHPASQGVKISKGNELEQCPYQVLDIVRDFDKISGFNIRILNWWGRGLFILVFIGGNNKRLMQDKELALKLHHHGYLLAKTSSSWDYKSMIDEGHLVSVPPLKEVEDHLRQYHYLQLVKKIPYSKDFSSLKRALAAEVEHILKFYKG